jgi:mono/diheme cytochrome c family protein
MKLMNKRIVLVTLLTINAIPFIAFQEKPKFDLKASIQRGAETYNAQCLSCHMEKGEGLEAVYPPLAKADYLMADKKRSILQVLYGVSGEIKVNGVVYNGEMPGFDLSNEEVSDVLNYIRNSWGNKGEAVKPEDVKAVRKE